MHTNPDLRLETDSIAESTDLGFTAFSEVSHGGRASIALVVIAFFILLAVLLRGRLYPCITLSKLNEVEVSLDDAYTDAVKNEYLRGHELDDIKHTRLRIKHRASEIRIQNLQTPTSIWKKCFNVDFKLISNIVTWYVDVEALQREISIVVEHERRHRYNVELGRRVMLATNV